MPADVNSPSPPSASRGEGELTSAGRLKIVENERRESQDGGGRARENWVKDKKARGGRELGFLDARSRRSSRRKKETIRILVPFGSSVDC